MNKEKFFSRYSKIFHTATLKDTLEAYRKLSQEERQKLKKQALSEASKKWHENNKEVFKQSMMGHKVSDETRRKMSESHKKYFSLKENRDKLSLQLKESFKKNPKSKETREKQSKSLKETYRLNPEIKTQISESVKKWHKENPNVISEKTKTAMADFYKTKKGQDNLKKWTDGSRAKGTSSLEKELQEFVKALDPNVILNDRSILDGKELDCYSETKKVAVEFNGNIWHSEAYKKEKAMNSQLEKTLLCEAKDIRLIHIFSDEWDYKQDIVKSIVASAFGVYNKKYFARKLKIFETDKKQGQIFFAKNHIQGDTGAERYFGLYDGTELVQCISIGKNRFKKDKSSYELIRMATKLNCQVVGGFSKLIKYAMTTMNIDTLGSYVDRRLFNHKGYSSSGWIRTGESGPRYFYTDGKKRENRQAYMKQRCLKRWPECNESMTEHEMCLAHGLYRIYDCGCIEMKFFLKS